MFIEIQKQVLKWAFFILRTFLKIQPKSAERILNLFTKKKIPSKIKKYQNIKNHAAPPPPSSIRRSVFVQPGRSIVWGSDLLYEVLIRLRRSEGSKMATAMWIKMADPRWRLFAKQDGCFSWWRLSWLGACTENMN